MLLLLLLSLLLFCQCTHATYGDWPCLKDVALRLGPASAGVCKWWMGGTLWGKREWEDCGKDVGTWYNQVINRLVIVPNYECKSHEFGGLVQWSIKMNT